MLRLNLETVSALHRGKAMTERLERIERMIEALAANQIEERERRLELREDIEILFQGQQQVFENWDLRHQRTQEDWDLRHRRTQEDMEARARLTQANIEAINAQLATLTALATADRAQVMADRVVESQQVHSAPAAQHRIRRPLKHSRSI